MRRHRTTALFVPLVIVGAAVAAFAIGPILVTGPSPYGASCDAGSSQPAYQDAEVEPFVATDPANSSHLIGVWQQDRYPNGGSRALGTAVSMNGGASWSRVTAPTFSRCAGGNSVNGGDLERATDPWVSIGPAPIGPGTIAYQISDSFNDSDTTNAILVSRSIDGGLTWQAPVTVLRESGARDVTFAFSDKESITADPTRPGHAYAIWDRLVGPSGKSNASASAFEHAQGFRGPTWFSRTTDGGVTWEPARQIYDPGQINQTIGNQIAVLPGGTLINTFDQIDNRKNAHGLRGENIAVQRSTDAGLTWGPAIIVAKGQSIDVVANDGTKLRTGDNIPDIAVGADNHVYLAWQDSRFTNGAHNDIAVAESADGGLTWGAPVRVNSGAVAAFNPAIEITAAGRLGVGYHELSSTGIVTRLLATSTAGAAGPWSSSVIATGGNITSAPNARGYFLGDYQGLTVSGPNLVSFFVNPNVTGPTNGTDVFSVVS